MAPGFFDELTRLIHEWGAELGFQQVGIAGVETGEHASHLARWLELSRHGEMAYMARYGTRRSRPAELIPGTSRVICVRMNYLPDNTEPEQVLTSQGTAYVSRYALGRDYHKVLRRRLVKLWQRIESHVEAAGEGACNGRIFTDSAPVLEKALAEQAGLGWIGKNTLLLNREAGSWFFLGEIYTDLPLTLNPGTASNHCGSCSACMDICPTDAIVAPYELDARRCISYLTIENRGPIPLEFREAIGNRIFGCDDCQLVCPWNKYAKHTREADFKPRHGLSNTALLALFLWSEDEFLKKTEGSAIRRTGYGGWLRNIAVALGNAPGDPAVIRALTGRQQDATPMLAEHIDWALTRQLEKMGQGTSDQVP